MKKSIKIYATLLSGSILLFGCNNNTTSPSGTTKSAEEKSIMNKVQCNPDPGLNHGALVLFSCAKTNLAVEDRNRIFDLCEFHVSKDSALYMKQDAKYLSGTAEDISMQLSVSTYCFDLNKDGIDEVLVQYGNLDYGGSAGNPSILFTKNKNGKIEKCLNTYGMDMLLLETSTKGWPDIVMGGGINHMGLFKWTGSNYKNSKQISQKQLDGMSLKRLREVATGSN